MKKKTAAIAGRRRVSVGVEQPLPAVMALADVARLLGVTRNWAYKLEADGHLRPFELPPLGRRKRYSGKRFQAWLDAEAHDPRRGRIASA